MSCPLGKLLQVLELGSAIAFTKGMDMVHIANDDSGPLSELLRRKIFEEVIRLQSAKARRFHFFFLQQFVRLAHWAIIPPHALPSQKIGPCSWDLMARIPSSRSSQTALNGSPVNGNTGRGRKARNTARFGI